MKKISITLIVIVLALSAVLMCACGPKVQSTEASLDFDNLGSRPNAQAAANSTPVDASKITLSSEETTDQAVLDSIEYLLKLSNQNNIDCDFFAAAAYGTGEAKIRFTGQNIVGNMDIREWRMYDNGEYFFDSYGLVVGGYTLKENGSKGGVPDSLVSLISGVLNYTERVYSPDGETFYKSKEGKADSESLIKFPSLDAIEYKKPKAQKTDVDTYIEEKHYRHSFKEFTTDNLDDENLTPITSGKLTYDEANGIYTLECEVNCEDERILDLSIKSMKQSSGTDIFKYAKKRLTIEIWECGLVKSYININRWEATLLPTSLKLQGASENFYNQAFTYNKEDIKIMVVPDEVKQSLMK